MDEQTKLNVLYILVQLYLNSINIFYILECVNRIYFLFFMLSISSQ